MHSTSDEEKRLKNTCGETRRKSKEKVPQIECFGTVTGHGHVTEITRFVLELQVEAATT